VFTSQPKTFEKSASRLFLYFLSGFVLSLIYWMWIFRHQLPAITDVFLNIYPGKVFNIDQYRQGIIPLWNGLTGCGTPQMASWQSSCFYPPFWIWNFLGNPDSITIMGIFHSGLACWGFFLWMRSQKVSTLPAFLGALSFSGSALFVLCWVHSPNMAVLTWIPWVFWSASRSLETKNKIYSLLSILFLALQILGGYPIFVFYTWLILGLWFIVQKPSRTDYVCFSLQLITALGLTALQWIPFGEFLTYCGRGGWWKDFPYFDKPIEYLALLNPHLLGDPGNALYPGSKSNFVFNPFIGLVPLGILISGWILLFKKNTENLFWKITSLFLLLWMSGSHLRIGNLFPENWLEALEPSKAVSLFVFTAATAAALQLQRWIIDGRKPWIHYALTLLCLFWFADVLAVPFQMLHPIPNLFQQTEMVKEADQIRQTVGNKRMLSLTQNSRLSYSGPDQIEKSVTGPASNFLTNSNSAWNLRSADYYLSVWVKNSQNLQIYANKGFPYQGDLLDAAGVGLFMLPQELSPPKYKTIGKWQDDFLIANNAASPDMRWVGQVVYFPDAPSILNILAQPHSGWREKVYLEKNTTGTILTLDPVSRSIPVQLHQGDSRSNNNRDAWTGAFPNPGYVIFNESYAPGWHAWVDGKPQPILRADGLFMAVPLRDGGLHQVDFRYEPASFRFGLFISLVSLGLLIFGVSIRRRED